MDLRLIVGEDKLSPEEAKNKAKIVSRAYFEDIKYYRPVIKPKKEENEMEPEKIDTTDATSEGVLGRVTVKGAVFIDVKDKTTYEIAKAYLKLFAEKLAIKEKSVDDN